MAVNKNNNTDIQSETHSIDVLDIPASLLSKLSPNQKKLIKTLADNHPYGLLSDELTQKIGVSNKSDLLHLKLKMLLASEGFEINIIRVSRQWLWKLGPIPSTEEGRA